MSPIGRVFIIVNLVLAAAFIGFAATFLQNHTNYKALWEEERGLRETETGQLQSQNDTLRDDNSALDLRLTQTQDRYEEQRTRNDALEAENSRLSARLDTMEGGINQINASTSTISETMQTQIQISQDAYSKALAADEEKDQAVQERERAVADLRDAEFRITQAQNEIEALTIQVADLQRELNQNEILLAGARERGFLPVTVQPDLRGVVSVVGNEGRTATVSITENPGDAEVTPGLSFAVYRDAVYKGEAVVTQVEGTFAFCRIVARPGTPRIERGDQAATKTDLN